MSILFLTNVGSRDVVLDGESQEDKGQPARRRGQRLNRQFKTLKEHLTLPIIDPAIRYLIRRQGGIDQVAVFGTDQPDEPLYNQPDERGVSYRDKDTLYYGHVASRWLKDRYGGQEVKKAKALQVEGINPSLYDEAFTIYGELLQGFVDEAVEFCYVLPAGGTPACNTALLLQAVRLFGRRCRVIHVSGGEAYELQAGRQVMGVMQENTAVSLLRSYNFAAARLLLEQQNVDEAMLALNDYARLRLVFDFETAREKLETAVNRGQRTVRAFALSIRGDLDNLLAGNDLALLGEVFQNAHIAWENGRYVDFLGRAFRLQEAIMRYLVSELYDGLDTDIKAREAFAAYIDERPHLRDYMTAQTHNGNPLSYESPNRIVFLALIRQAMEKGVAGDPNTPLETATKEQIRTIYPLLERIERLGDLRNKTILAHGYQGASRRIILNKYAAETEPVADMKAACRALGTPLDDPFQNVAEFLIDQLSAAHV